ncbi:dehydrogenase/reductase sdr family member 2-like protein [Dermatophagoides farinae]|nr:dehydrogenase/reductase sdr family member 2-like protein [Dermatophagoides farinae]
MSSTATTSGKKYNFSGKVAIVTGSSSGIGAAIALQMAQFGAQVTITGRDADALESVAKQIEDETGNKPLQIVGNLLDQSLPSKLIDETISKFGRLDFLVNSAGGSTPHRDLSDEKLLEGYDEVYAVNVRAIIQLTQLAVPHLEKTKGNIINISSASSMVPYGLIYSSSKAALDMVTKSLAQELAPKGIRVNSINPGPVVTHLYRSFGMTKEANAEHEPHLRQNLTLLKFLPQPVEIANLASFLASDDARNMTGSIVVSDTGFMLVSK